MRMTAAQLQAIGYAQDGTRIGGQLSNSPTQAATREADLHDAILAYCRSRGWPVVHSRMDRPATCGVGTPDFVVALPAGITLWVEAKAHGGKLRPEQLAWLTHLRSVGHRAEVVRSFEEFVRIASTNPPAVVTLPDDPGASPWQPGQAEAQK